VEKRGEEVVEKVEIVDSCGRSSIFFLFLWVFSPLLRAAAS